MLRNDLLNRLDEVMGKAIEDKNTKVLIICLKELSLLHKEY